MHQPIWPSWRSRLGLYLGASVCLGCLVGAEIEPANALPGQTVEEATAWIQAHPTLQPATGETLLIRKSDTPAHRFTFEASTNSPGRAMPGDGNLIRLEQLSFFDRINGVSPTRLQEALHVIYGAEIYEDYQQASIVYQYPNLEPDLENLETESAQETPLQASIQGEIRQGDRYAYWLETAPTLDGIAYNGQISVFLIEDVEKLVMDLQER